MIKMTDIDVNALLEKLPISALSKMTKDLLLITRETLKEHFDSAVLVHERFIT
jgi:hypothetical protein